FVSEWWPIIRYGISHDWRRLFRFPGKLAEDDAWGNFIAFKNPPDEAALQAFAKSAVDAKGPAPVMDDLARMSGTELRAEVESIASGVPTSASIFLPTNKIPLGDQVRGMRRVREIYEDRLDRIYRPKLRELRRRFAGRRRCFIIGNGPSLNDTDLELLKDEVTFAVNGFFLMAQKLSWKPTFYVVEDHLVAEDRKDQIAAFKGPIKLFPVYLAYCLDEGEDTVFFRHLPRKSYPDGFDFSTDACDATYAGCTVTYTCMQLAYYLGFDEIYLVGVDADYSIPSDASQSSAYGVGVLDMKSDDPNHFHRDYFGKGYRWHDPQVDKMVEAYREAKRVIEGGNRLIRNATVGGKLEVFERADYTEIVTRPADMASPLGDDGRDYPRILVVDPTPVGDLSATGQLKASLFDGWPVGGYMQLFNRGNGEIGVLGGLLLRERIRRLFLGSGSVSDAEAMRLVRRFKPDLIVLRPTPDHLPLHWLGLKLFRALDIPAVVWIVDDWPAQVQANNPKLHTQLDRELREMLRGSSLNLSIGTAMSRAFAERYEVSFSAYANGVVPEQWPESGSRVAGDTFKVRYAGALAENMTLESVVRVAQAVEKLAQAGLAIVFEIKTSQLWFDRVSARFKQFGRTTIIVEDMTADRYRAWLAGADAVIIAYNFDDASRTYVQYSMANKLP
ncbi:MAG: DUF115 domain-containing protein, partial [Caldilineaceae bacterium]|nr:DUF115 domain-containing protein [Caldilineaceae bacterium]